MLNKYHYIIAGLVIVSIVHLVTVITLDHPINYLGLCFIAGLIAGLSAISLVVRKNKDLLTIH